MNILDLAILKKLGGGGGNANIDVTAEVGQTIIVKEVDANGKPTKWESADYQERICWTDETVVLPETTVETFDGGDGMFVATLPAFTLVGGKKYLVNYNGTEYECECLPLDVGDGTFSYALGDLGLIDGTFPLTGEPFLINTIPLDGFYMIVPLDGATTITISIAQVDVTPIPQKYVTNAFPYYVELSGSGTTDDPYVCNDTVANLDAIYNSGRQITVRKADDIGFCFYHLFSAGRMATGMLFVFSRHEGNANVAYLHSVYFAPKSDGTYLVTEKLSDLEELV